MAIKIKDLVKKLQGKDQDDEVEFIVVTTTGKMVCMDIKTQAPNTLELLKLFNNEPPFYCGHEDTVNNACRHSCNLDKPCIKDYECKGFIAF